MDILKSFFLSNPNFSSNHHIESYNEFINIGVYKTIKSMNPFQILKKNTKFEIRVFIGGKESNAIYFKRPTNLPMECRLNNQTYEANLHADVYIEYEDSKGVHNVEFKDVFLCKIPVMIKSTLCSLENKTVEQLLKMGECPYDVGGYFIVDGKEKVIVAQEKNVSNKLFIDKLKESKNFAWQAFIRCVPQTEESVFPKTLWLYLTNPCNIYVGNDQSENVLKRIIKANAKANLLCVKVNSINNDAIPIVILFKALGIENDKLLVNTIFGSVEDMSPLEEEIIVNSINAASALALTQARAIEYLAQFTKYKANDNVLYILREHFLPNVKGSLMNKAIYLGYLVRTFLGTITGSIPMIDRDNFMYKRVWVSGMLLKDIFKDFYNDFRVQTRSKIDNLVEFTKLDQVVNKSNYKEVFAQSQTFQLGLIKSLKGKWGLISDVQGIVQDLNRSSYAGFLSHLRRVSSEFDPAIKMRKPHQLTCSQWGVMCPCESPDGANIGLLKNMAMMCTISYSIPIDVVYKALNTIKAVVGDGDIKININNNWVNNTRFPFEVYNYFRLLKKTGHINHMIGVSWNILKKEININIDAGRCCRPLVVARKSFKKGEWKSLVLGSNPPINEYHTTFMSPFDTYQSEIASFSGPMDQKIRKVISLMQADQGVIEYLEVEETNYNYIAMMKNDVKPDSQHTHYEIHPATALSLYTCTIPFLSHNPSTRIVFSGAQGKQAIGVYATNWAQRIDTMGYVLHYPQKPIISTPFTKYVNADKLPNGENLIVAIATYSGYNQDDSVIMNKASIERGMFNLSYFKAVVNEEKNVNVGKYETIKTTFENPKNKNIKLNLMGNYNKIDENGMPEIDTYFDEGDCILGQVRKTTTTVVNDDKASDMFPVYSKIVEFNSACTLADKTVSGYVDKIKINYDADTKLHSAKIKVRKMRIPELGDKLASRHGQKGVIGMIMPSEDMPFTKEGLVPDIIINPNAIPSRMTIGHLLECVLANQDVKAGMSQLYMPFDSITEALGRTSQDNYANSVMYNGITGEQIDCAIFIGPTYYFRLKHMVADKVNSRTEGRMVSLTHQPTKGRGAGGGLRIGEMETNVLISHGIAAFAKESMMERSDKYEIVVDDEGRMFPYNKKKRMLGDTQSHHISLPYSFKLLVQELNTMSVDARLVTE